MFDRELIAHHFARRSGADDFVTALALEDLATRLITVTRTFEAALIMAPDARSLPVMGRSANGIFHFERAATVAASEGAPLVDAEALALPRTDYDLIVSVFDLTVVNDVVGFLARLRRHLRPDGLFMAVAIGGASLNELREAWLTAEVRGERAARSPGWRRSFHCRDAGGSAAACRLHPAGDGRRNPHRALQPPAQADGGTQGDWARRTRWPSGRGGR